MALRLFRAFRKDKEKDKDKDKEKEKDKEKDKGKEKGCSRHHHGYTPVKPVD